MLQCTLEQLLKFKCNNSMYLKEFTVLNNKSCKKVHLDFSENEPKTLIGINDCGKSTILQSLRALFEEKTSLTFIKEQQQKSDLSNSPLTIDEFNTVFETQGLPLLSDYNQDMIVLFAKFRIEPADLTDEFKEGTKNIHLKWSVEGKEEFHMMRVFHNLSGGVNRSGYYLIVKDLEENTGFLEAWNKTKADLKTIRSRLSISSETVTNENGKGPFTNLEEIRAIYSAFPEKVVSRWSLYKDYSKDQSFFPHFKYLNWEFSLQDLEELANEAMNEVTAPLLDEVKILALTKQIEANTGVNSKFDSLVEGLKSELPASIQKITSSVYFKVDQKITDIKLQKEGSDGEIHLENQGDGIKRQIWFAILKWRSKLTTGDRKNKHIWCFDEPETHLYPTAQRTLFSTFQEMCQNEFQVVLSTHSTVFIDRTKIIDVTKANLEAGYTVTSQTNSIDDIHEALGLKNSDFLFFDKFLAVEGPTEEILIPHFYKLYKEESLESSAIQLIPLGGAGDYRHNKTILENILRDFKKTESTIHYIFDQDTGEVGPNIHLVGTCDLEDLLPNALWIRLVSEKCGVVITESEMNVLRGQLDPNVANSKLHKLLMDRVASDVSRTDYMPSKPDCAKIFSSYITVKSDIPKDITDIFDSFA